MHLGKAGTCLLCAAIWFTRGHRAFTCAPQMKGQAWPCILNQPTTERNKWRTAVCTHSISHQLIEASLWSFAFYCSVAWPSVHASYNKLTSDKCVESLPKMSLWFVMQLLLCHLLPPLQLQIWQIHSAPKKLSLVGFSVWSKQHFFFLKRILRTNTAKMSWEFHQYTRHKCHGSMPLTTNVVMINNTSE